MREFANFFELILTGKFIPRKYIPIHISYLYMYKSIDSYWYIYISYIQKIIDIYIYMDIIPCKFLKNFKWIDGFGVVWYSLISVSKESCITGYKSILLHKAHQLFQKINKNFANLNIIPIFHSIPIQFVHQSMPVFDFPQVWWIRYHFAKILN